MKKPALILLIVLLFTSAKAQTPDSFLGKWAGSGILYNTAATFSMEWERILNEQFYRLTFRNALDNGAFSMNAHGYYQFNNDSTFSGYWLDSRGVSFPLNGHFSKNTLTVFWGSKEREEGKSVYESISPNSMKVTDFVIRNGEYQQFAGANYTRFQTNTSENEITGFTLASLNINATKKFYEKVFGVVFEPREMFEAELFEGTWLGFTMLICPADVAQNSAEQNRHQFDIEVENLDEMIAKVQKYGGTLMHDIIEENGVRKVGIYDPDNNSMVLIEKTNN